MKKNIILTSITTIFLVVVIIITNVISDFPPINKNMYIFKMILYYLFTIACLTIILFYPVWLKLVDPKSNRLKIVIIFVCTILFSFILILTPKYISYVNYKVTPYTENYSYFDEYNNLVYQSKFFSANPEIKVTVDTKDKLEFTVLEESNFSELERLEILTSEEIKDFRKNKLVSDVEIHYNSTHQITYINQLITINEFDYVKKEASYYSFHSIITNAFNTGFTRVVKKAEYTKTYDYAMDYNLEHYNFNSESYEVIKYDTINKRDEVINIDGEVINGSKYEFVEELYDNDTVVTKKLADITFYFKNSYKQYSIDLYVDDDNENNTNAIYKVDIMKNGTTVDLVSYSPNTNLKSSICSYYQLSNKIKEVSYTNSFTVNHKWSNINGIDYVSFYNSDSGYAANIVTVEETSFGKKCTKKVYLNEKFGSFITGDKYFKPLFDYEKYKFYTGYPYKRTFYIGQNQYGLAPLNHATNETLIFNINKPYLI